MQRAQGGGGGVAMPNFGEPKNERQQQPHTALAVALCHTNWCASQARLASPRHAPPRLTAAVYMSMAVTVSLLLPAATDIDFHTRAAAAAAAKMLQQDDSSTWAKKLPQFSNYSQNFMPTKANSACWQPEGVCHTNAYTHTRTRWGVIVRRQVLCNIFGCHCQQLLQQCGNKTNQNEFVQLCSTFKYTIPHPRYVCVCVCEF